MTTPQRRTNYLNVRYGVWYMGRLLDRFEGALINSLRLLVAYGLLARGGLILHSAAIESKGRYTRLMTTPLVAHSSARLYRRSIESTQRWSVTSRTTQVKRVPCSSSTREIATSTGNSVASRRSALD